MLSSLYLWCLLLVISQWEVTNSHVLVNVEKEHIKSNETLPAPEISVLEVGSTFISFLLNHRDFDVLSYVMEYELVSEPSKVKTMEWEKSPDDSIYILQGLRENGTYRFRAQANTTVGSSNWTQWIEQTLDRYHEMGPATPHVITPQNGTKVEPGIVEIQWSVPQESVNSTDYYVIELYQSVDSESETFVAKYQMHHENHYLQNQTYLPNIQNGKKYHVKIFSVCVKNSAHSIPADVYFFAERADRRQQDSIRLIVMVSALGVSSLLLFIVSVSFCVYCHKHRNK